MTDRVNAYVVTLEDIADAWLIRVAIEQLRGVKSVDPHWAAPDGMFAQMRLDNVVELRRR